MRPLPTTLRTNGPISEFAISLFLSRSLALALTVSRLYRSVYSALWLNTRQFAFSRLIVNDYTAEQRLAEVNKAIQAVLLGGQSYKLGSRSVTRADLALPR